MWILGDDTSAKARLLFSAVTADNSLAVYWEHVVAVTDTGCEVFDLREGKDVNVLRPPPRLSPDPCCERYVEGSCAAYRASLLAGRHYTPEIPRPARARRAPSPLLYSLIFSTRKSKLSQYGSPRVCR
jgi:hypothetical protein